MNRWEINKYGFVNFWLFDKEEIKTYGGNLLLTGENGSGKSVTLQSFIPLIFDGNTSSRRLSTEGDNSRQIEYYLLYGDKKETISYIYAELVKENDNGNKEYISLVIGMKLKQGQITPKKWFSIIKNKRIGKEIELYSYNSEYIEPFDKSELKKKLENQNVDFEFYEEASEYKQAVNNNIFGFKNIDEFEETIDLIVELRQPNLRDNTGFDPKYIYEILNKSLKIISEKDLKSISDTFEKIEEISEELKQEQEQFKILKKIDIHYNNYKNIVLARGLGDFKKKYELYKTNLNQIDKNKKNIEKLEEVIDKLSEKREKLGIEKENIIREIAEIRDESSSLLDKKEAKKSELREIDSSIEKLEKAIVKSEEFVRKYSELKNKNKKEYDDYEKEYLELEEKIKILEDRISFKSGLNYLDILEMKKENAFISANYNFESHKKNLEKLTKLIDENKFNNEKLKEAFINKDKENKNLFNLEEKLKEIEKENIEKLGEFSRKIAERKEQILNLNYGEIQEILEILEDFEENEFYDKLRKNIENIKQGIFKNLNEYKRIERNLLDDIEDIKNKKKELENQVDIKIEMLSHKKNERNKLIEIKSFYEVVKFKDEVEKEVQGKIEKALWEMGILDALLTEDNTIFDRILVKSEKTSNNLTKFLEVEETFENKEKIIEILSSISIDKNENIYVTENGEYKNLIIQGKVDKWEGKYIGIEARKKLREDNINRLNKEISNLEERVYIIKENIEEINEKFKILEFEEKQILSIFKELFYEIYKIHKETISEIIFVKKRVEEWEHKIKIYEEKAIQSNKILENESKKLGLNINDFNQIKEFLKEFEDIFIKIKDKYNIILKIHSTFKNAEEMEQENEGKLEEQKRERRLYLKKKEDINQIIYNLDKEIEEKGYSQKLKRLEILEEQKEIIIPQKLQKISEDFGIQKNRVESLKKNLEEEYKISEKVEEDYKISNSLINEELNQTDYNLDNSLYYTDELKINLYENYKNYEVLTTGKDYGEITSLISSNELLLKPFGLKLEEYSFIETKEKYDLKNYSRERFVLKAVTKGRNTEFKYMLDLLEEQIGRRSEYLNEEEQKFFREMLFGYINKEIADRIKESKEWVNRIDKIMARAKTNSGKRYSLKWTPKNVGFGMTGERLYQSILNVNNPSERGKESESLIKEYFYKKTKELKNNAQNENTPKSSYEILKEVLDYRNWHEFNMSVVETATGKSTVLTKRKLNSFSGGEKAMAMYIPLFSALYARFSNGASWSLMIISMDEAFSVVDDENIAKLFEILEDLNLNYLLASQKLSGTYDTVKKLAIVYIENMSAKKKLKGSEGFISLIRYLWDGIERKKDLRNDDEGGQRLLF